MHVQIDENSVNLRSGDLCFELRHRVDLKHGIYVSVFDVPRHAFDLFPGETHEHVEGEKTYWTKWVNSEITLYTNEPAP